LVTAIVIPIICIYFYYISKKEIRIHTEKWLALEDVYEEATILGKIQQISERKERYYYHRYVHVLEITLVSNNTANVVTKLTPIAKGKDLSYDFQIGDTIRVYGNWKEGYFRFKRYDLLYS